jgi:anti-sigma regulatory factor (Ser/Thr protein kinase)
MPDNLESAKIGGLGIHLARQFSDSMLYERIDGTNRVSLTFKVPQ